MSRNDILNSLRETIESTKEEVDLYLAKQKDMSLDMQKDISTDRHLGFQQAEQKESYLKLRKLLRL